ncbi:MAG: CRTAC1 family protein, partial [Verrucomicrobiota bacterium]
MNDGSVVPAFADFDRDGDLDLYILTHQVYRNQGRPSEPIGIVEENGKLAVAPEWRRWYAVDQNERGENGEILYVEVGRPDYFFRNDGEKGFTEITRQAGITKDKHWGNSATWWDYNHDGWPDLYVGNDFKSPDFMYRNNGDGTFTEVSVGQVRHTTWFSMGAVQSDLNNDGLIDFVLADMLPRTHYMQKASMASMKDRLDNLESVDGARQMMRNTVHINTGTDRFLESAWMSGVAATEWTWAIRSADFDCDGLSDLFFCNGVPRQFNHTDLPEINHSTLVGKTHWDHYRNTPERREQNMAYRNRGNLDFEDVSAKWGLAHVGMSYGASLGDLDGDGRLELVTSNLDDPLSIYWNRGNTGNRMVVDLIGRTSNRHGIGAVAKLTTESHGVQIRQLFPYGGFLDADETMFHFGLGEDTEGELTIEWPSGIVQNLGKLQANQKYVVTEPETSVDFSKPVTSR